VLIIVGDRAGALAPVAAAGAAIVGTSEGAAALVVSPNCARGGLKSGEA